jgi:hypothetical protein
MIVTNDEFELPVKMDIFGAKAAADYLGIPEQTLRTCLHRDSWCRKTHRYKAVVDEDATIRIRAEHKAEMDAHWKYKRAFDPAYRERRHKYDRERMSRHIGRAKPYDCSYPVMAERPRIPERSKDGETNNQ